MLRVWTINADGDTSSWYEIWEALTAVFFKCISQGLRGTLRGLGESHDRSLWCMVLIQGKRA